MKIFLFVLITIAILVSCKENRDIALNSKKHIVKSIQDQYLEYDELFKKHSEFIATSFDYPVGKPNAKGYYNAQKFTKNNHLGDDWNGVNGGNSDLGDPI